MVPVTVNKPDTDQNWLKFLYTDPNTMDLNPQFLLCLCYINHISYLHVNIFIRDYLPILVLCLVGGRLLRISTQM